jgi:sulfite exporter TauE/SafE
VDAPIALPLAALLLGLASGVHCIGMCGGIVAAFSSKNVSAKYVVRGPKDRSAGVSLPSLILFNTGRVTSYTLAGAVAGALGSAGALAAHFVDLQVASYVIANVMLVLIGLHLAGVSPMLAQLEKVGAPVWRRIQPLAVRFLPADTPVKALVAGSLWGWLPCGLVYGMLATSIASGTVAGGALTMLAFGLGTMPNLLLAGVALAQLRRFAARKEVRLAVGGLVIAFGLAGLARSAALGEMVRRGLDCFR